MRLLIALPKAVHRDMGIDLGGGQAAVAQDLLHRPKIRAPVQQMRGGGVAQRVGPGSGSVPERLEEGVDQGTDLALVNSSTARPEEKGGSAAVLYKDRAPPAEPVVDGHGGRDPEGDGAFLVALADYPERPAVRVKVVDVEAAKFPHPDTRGVEEFHHGPAP